MSVVHWFEDLGSWIRTFAAMAWQRSEGRGTDHLRQPDRAMERTFVERLHPRRMKLEVERVIDETPTTKTFRLRRTDGDLPPFRAGQYVNLFVTIDDVHTSRPYSIASAPGEPFIELTVRAKPNGFVSPYLVRAIKAGDELECTGPQGQFRYEPLIDGNRLVLLAGGSGITPFMSMLRDQAKQGFPLDICLLYGSRREDDVIFGDELAELVDSFEHFRYVLVISEPTESHEGESGLLAAERIERHVGELAGKTYFICGPSAMLDFCRRALDQLGIARHRIRTEGFSAPQDVTTLPGWPEDIAADHEFQVEVESGPSLSTAAGEPLMNALERHGVALPAVCRSGLCSACRTKLVAGQVFLLPTHGIRESDRRHGYIHPCAAYPVSDLRIRI